MDNIRLKAIAIVPFTERGKSTSRASESEVGVVASETTTAEIVHESLPLNHLRKLHYEALISLILRFESRSGRNLLHLFSHQLV